MPPPTDSIVPQTVEAGHIITENKSNNALDYVHNDQLESLRYSSNEEDTEYPEGGTSAWLVVLGAWCAMIPSMGLLNTVGVLQAWVSENQLQGYSESNIGWIFSAYAFFLYIGGAQVGKYTLMFCLIPDQNLTLLCRPHF